MLCPLCFETHLPPRVKKAKCGILGLCVSGYNPVTHLKQGSTLQHPLLIATWSLLKCFQEQRACPHTKQPVSVLDGSSLGRAVLTLTRCLL